MMAVSEKTSVGAAMTEVTVRVPTRLVEMAEAQVAGGRFADVGAVIEHALDEYDERERKLIHLRALLQEGLDSGEPIELTDDHWDEIWQEAEERHARGELPDPVVCP